MIWRPLTPAEETRQRPAAFVYPVFIPVTQGFWVSSLLVFLNRSVLPLARVKAYWRLQIILRSSGLRYT